MELINRPIVTKIKKQVEKGNIAILVGARQVGKTSILRLLIEDIKKEQSEKRLFYFDLEKEEFLEIFQSYRTLIDWLKLQGAELEKTNYLFIDEFHYIPNPTKIFKIIHDDFPNLKIVATGSSSLEISDKIEEAMTGRKRVFRIYPLSFEEFLRFKKSPLEEVFLRVKNNKLKLVEPTLTEFIREWEEFLLFGGYPKIALTLGAEEKAKELEEIYNSYVQKDIKAFLKIENVLAFNKLVKILAVQITNLANLSQIGSPLRIARGTLEKYIFVLENTFIVKIIPPFFSNKTKEITKMGKILFYDIGLRNFSIKDFKELGIRIDRGTLVENAVAIELIKHSSVFEELQFWRTHGKAEVDFVLAGKSDVIPIEVKYQSFKSPKIPSGLKAFINNYKPQKAYCLTRNFSSEINFKSCKVKFLPTFLCSALIG